MAHFKIYPGSGEMGGIMGDLGFETERRKSSIFDQKIQFENICLENSLESLMGNQKRNDHEIWSLFNCIHCLTSACLILTMVISFMDSSNISIDS